MQRPRVSDADVDVVNDSLARIARSSPAETGSIDRGTIPSVDSIPPDSTQSVDRDPGVSRARRC